MSASLTHHRDLRTGRSPWMARRGKVLSRTALPRRSACDVLVVGAGISGALIAEQLSDAGLRVIVVDRRRPVSGSTLASTALLQYEIDVPLCKLARAMGRERAERIWRRSKLPVDALRERTERLGIRAATASRATLYLDGDLLDADGLALEADARRRAGFEVELLDPTALAARFGIIGRHGIVGYGNYSADPRQLAAGYLQVALSRGAMLHSPVDIAGFETGQGRVLAHSTGGHEIDAGAIVLASGYETVRGVPARGNRITSTWAIGTRAQPRAIWPEAAMVWEAAQPYLYIRTTPAGEVICGGEDEPIADAAQRDSLTAQKAAILAEKLGRLFPALDTRPAFAWAGTFGESPCGTPTIGRIPGKPHCYAAMGYGGNGITFAMMAAQMLRGMILGSGDPDADLTAFVKRP